MTGRRGKKDSSETSPRTKAKTPISRGLASLEQYLIGEKSPSKPGPIKNKVLDRFKRKDDKKGARYD